MYSQIKVTIKPKAALHSNCLGAPLWTPFSIKSKSATKKRDAIPITKSENPIPTGPFPWIKGTWKPKKKPINDIRYITKIAPNKAILMSVYPNKEVADKAINAISENLKQVKEIVKVEISEGEVVFNQNSLSHE